MNTSIRLFISTLLSSIITYANVSYAASTLIFGDSLATGAATHPELKYDSQILLQVFDEQIKVTADKEQIVQYVGPENNNLNLVTPTYLRPTIREFRGGLDWAVTNLMDILSAHYLNTAEYSWGYLTATKLGWNKEVYMAARNGARIIDLPRQIDRYLSAGYKQFPEKIFILFTGNDLCGQSLDLVTKTEDFKKQMIRGLRYLLINGQASPAGTDIYVLNYLSVLQLVTGQSILDKEVVAHGQKTTCRKLRENAYQPMQGTMPSDQPRAAVNLSKRCDEFQFECSLLASFVPISLPPNPAAMCPTLFAHPKIVSGHVSQLANRVRAYRKATKESVGEMNRFAKTKYPSEDFKFYYLEDTGHITFEGEDIADDCFHLNLVGQKKLAEVVRKNILKLTDDAQSSSSDQGAQ